MSQLTRAVITGLPSTVPASVKRCAATVPARIPDRRYFDPRRRDRHTRALRALLGIE
jgi:hypothetical protein